MPCWAVDWASRLREEEEVWAGSSFLTRLGAILMRNIQIKLEFFVDEVFDMSASVLLKIIRLIL
jgi:hypothetical protein